MLDALNIAPAGEVIPFVPPSATHITTALLDSARAAAVILPPGVFTVGLVRETGDNADDVTDFVAVDQLRGPPFGDFQVRRERGRFLVLKSLDASDIVVGFFTSTAAAFRAIRADIDATWAGWSMTGDVTRAVRTT